MSYVVTIPPTTEPVTLDQAKAYLRVDWDDDDADISDMISQARDWLELKLGRAFVTQTIRATLGLVDLTIAPLSGVIGTNALSYAIELPQPPLQSVSLVEMETQVDQWTSLVVTDDYLIDYDGAIGRVFLASSALEKWAVSLNYPGSKPRIRVTYTAGYGSTAASVPYAIRANLKNIIAWLYENRGNSGIPDTLMQNEHKVWRL